MTTGSNKQPLNYLNAGVDPHRGYQLVERIKPLARATARAEVLSGIGGFGAAVALGGRFRDPVLVSGTDGVGTKLKLAQQLHRHHSIGQDLVAMCVNDIVTSGAEPLFFLDYFSTSYLDVDVATEVIAGIAAGCQLAGCALVGGETAEMPGMYQPGDYDLAGFAVGVVERERLISGNKLALGDVLIGLASSGAHSNGYSLIRAVLAQQPQALEHAVLADGQRLADALMAPTRIYVSSLLKLFEQVEVHALAHITGGGWWENIPRLLPADSALSVVIERASVPTPPVFDWLQQHGQIDPAHMFEVFNLGLGMVVALAPQDVDAALACLAEHGENAYVVGHIAAAGASALRIE